MKKLMAFVLAAAFIFSLIPAASASAAYASVAPDYSSIRVKLSTNNATAITMNVTGEYFIEETGACFTGGALTLSAANGTITVSHSSAGEIYQGRSFKIKRVTMDAKAGYLYFNSRRYLGHFNVSLLSSGYIQVVNEVPMAHYLYGVVAYEMNNLYPKAALMAQAVAAKCYAITCINSNPNANYHIGDTSADQVYKGYNSSYTTVMSAVDSTMDTVLTVNGSILRTYYSASNGGETNLPKNAWPTKNITNAGYGVLIDDYDIANTLSLKEVVKLPINSQGTISDAMYQLILAKAYSALGMTPERITAITACDVYYPKCQGVSRDMSRMTLTVNVLAGGQEYIGVALDFSTGDLTAYGVFTNGNLRTCWGEYSSDGSCYYIYHMRYGHGVGLSQRGAQQRGAAGQSYLDILSFYYPSATISTISIPLPQDPVKPTSVKNLTAAGTGKTTTSVNMRTGPGTSYALIKKLAKKTDLTVYGYDNGWYHVLVTGTYDEGYVSGDYVSYTPNAEATPTPAATDSLFGSTAQQTPTVAGYGVITSGGVNLRTGPAVSYDVKGTMLKDTPVSILGTSGGWYYILVGNTYGYVSGEFVRVTAQATPAPTVTPDAYTPEATPAPTETPAATATVQTAVITANSVSLRSGPGSSYTLLRKLAKNTGAVVLSKRGNWYNVTIGSENGYVYKDYVRLTTAEESAAVGGAGTGTPNTPYSENAASTPTTGAGTTTGSVNLRVGPAQTYTKLATLSKDTSLTLFALKDGWYQVKDAKGREGYVSSKYVRVTVAIPENITTQTGASATGTSSALDTPSGGAAATGTGVTTSSVNFRESPSSSSSSKIIAKLKAGVTVTLYSQTGSWYEASYNGTRGYLYAKYVQKLVTAAPEQTDGTTGGISTSGGISSAAGGVTLSVGTTSGRLNLRNKPSQSGSSVLQVLSANDEFYVLGETGEWYYVLAKNTTGYVYKPYVKLTSSGTAGVAKAGDTLTCLATVTTAEVNLRAGRGVDYAKIDTLPKGTAVNVYMVTDDWCLVYVGGRFGFCSSEYIKL